MIKMRPSVGLVLTSLAVLAIAGSSAEAKTQPTPPTWPLTDLHYTPNDSSGLSGRYLPGADGFNLADVKGSKSELDRLPVGVRGLVWLGDCGGATAGFRSAVDTFAGDPKLFGFYVMDDPAPSTCPAANLLAEDNWIHTHVPGGQTFSLLQNLGRATSPTFAGSYTPRNSGLDLIGLDPYPVRSELHSPDYAEIARYVRAAEAIGWPSSSIVPVYQAFGGGAFADDDGGHWVLPTAAQERQILADWAAVIPDPKFDYAYSWGSQKGDAALSRSPALQAVFVAKNAHPSRRGRRYRPRSSRLPNDDEQQRARSVAESGCVRDDRGARAPVRNGNSARRPGHEEADGQHRHDEQGNADIAEDETRNRQAVALLPGPADLPSRHMPADDRRNAGEIVARYGGVFGTGESGDKVSPDSSPTTLRIV
jgi:hypothetical protein